VLTCNMSSSSTLITYNKCRYPKSLLPFTENDKVHFADVQNLILFAAFIFTSFPFNFLVIFVIYKKKNFCCSRNGCQTYTFYMRKKTIIFNNLILCINYVLRMGLFNSYKNKEGELYCADLYWCMHFIALLQIGFSVR